VSTSIAESSRTPAWITRWRARVNGIVFHAMSISMGSLAVVLGRVGSDKGRVWRFAKAQARLLCRMCGVRVEIRGLDRLSGGPFVFAPNHQSHFDIALLLGYLPGHNRFATKIEMFQHPVMGPILRALGMIPIDRDNPAAAIQALSQLHAERLSVIIFPEGTRSRDGRLLPFKKGAFATAIGMRVPVVPVVCKGTAPIMPKGHPFIVNPGAVEIVVLPPIPTAGLAYADRDRLRDLVREQIARELEH
jgi:1-acyl-sn-glycerol-3-phosphate acyltransferase